MDLSSDMTNVRDPLLQGPDSVGLQAASVRGAFSFRDFFSSRQMWKIFIGVNYSPRIEVFRSCTVKFKL